MSRVLKSWLNANESAYAYACKKHYSDSDSSNTILACSASPQNSFVRISATQYKASANSFSMYTNRYPHFCCCSCAVVRLLLNSCSFSTVNLMLFFRSYRHATVSTILIAVQCGVYVYWLKCVCVE